MENPFAMNEHLSSRKKIGASFPSSVFGLLLLLLSSTAVSQSIQLQGTVLDSLEGPLVGASIILKHAADDQLEAFAIAGASGEFKMESNAYGDFNLQITYIGYGTFERPLTLKEGEELVDFGSIILRASAYDLDDITIKDSFIPIVIKKDTIEYNAAAFKTRPNASVEDLLKKLPGIDVEKDGTIKSQGEEVQSILVDGKEFFDDDPKIASRNIPAEVVDKVQLFDRKSEFSEFTGIDDGNEAKTINLAIKEGKNKGLFGNVKGAYGTDDRYGASTSLNRFNEKMQLSAVGNLNNINEQVFSLMDYLKFTGGLGEVMSGEGMDMSQLPLNLLDYAGNNDLYSGGLNFNYDFTKKTELRSNYFYNLSKNKTRFSSTMENVLGEGSFTKNSFGDQVKQLANHRLKFKLKHKFDKTQDFTAKFTGGFSEIDDQQYSMSDALLNTKTLVNRSQLDFGSSLTQGDWESDFIYRKKLKKKGRFFTTEFGLSGGSKEGDELVNNKISFYENELISNADSIDQQQNLSAQSINYKANLNYVEPLGKANYLNFSLSRENTTDQKEKIFSDRIDPDFYKVNEFLSSDFERDYYQNKGGIGFKMMRPKYNFSLGLDYQILDLKNVDQRRGEPFNKRFPGLLPKARFSYQFNQTSQFRTGYSTRMRAPSIEQLQPVQESSSLTDAYIGNPNLSAEYIHQLGINYNNFDRFYFRSLFTGFQAQYVQKPISNAISITDELVSVTQPINSKDEWMMGFYYEYESPVQGKNLKFSLEGDYRMQRSNVLTNETLERANITSLSQSLSIENKKKHTLDWSLSGSINPNFTSYKNNKQQDQNFFDYTLSSDIVWYINDSWYCEVNLEHEAYSAASFGTRTHINYIHTSLNKSFLDEKFMLSLKGVNLLNEHSLIQRNSFGNQYSEMERNRLGRYFLLGLTYKIRSFGK